MKAITQIIECNDDHRNALHNYEEKIKRIDKAEELDKIKISNKALKDYYNKNKDEFDKTRDTLAEMFIKNYKKYQDGEHTDYAPFGPIVGS